MEFRQSTSTKRGRYRPYSSNDLHEAYTMVLEDGLPVERVAKIFQIPITTLKDRVRGRISIDSVRSGPQNTFTQEQEAFLCKHLATMAEMGYGYTRQETINLATDYAAHLGLRRRDRPLSLTWLYSFLERWPELKLKKPRSLEIARAKSATRSNIDRYFTELETILVKYNLKDKPSHIYNIDEKGLSLEHKPPKIIAGSHYKAQAVTAGKSKTVTVIGGGNALGQQVPPYFIFPGARMQPGLMEGAAPGSHATMSESGWSNSEIFETYMKDHFEPILPTRSREKPVLVLYDGHKSHISIGLVEWARQHHIILFVLPPHCSHLLQPMDVSCFGPFEVGWNAACHQHIRESGGSVVTRYNVSKIASKVYISTLTPANIQSAFRRCGIFPFNKNVVSAEAIAPSLSFQPPADTAVSEHVEGSGRSVETNQDARLFLEKRGGEVLKNVTVAKVRKTVSKVVGGKPITEDSVYENLKSHVAQQKQSKTLQKKKLKSDKSKKYTVSCRSMAATPQPGTSGLSKAVNVDPDLVNAAASEVSDSGDENDIEVCCVCERFTPVDLKHCVSLTIVKWGCCEKCDRWVHLGFCSSVKVLRRNDSFLCPKCTSEE